MDIHFNFMGTISYKYVTPSYMIIFSLQKSLITNSQAVEDYGCWSFCTGLFYS